jgi:hypothetical protein
MLPTANDNRRMYPPARAAGPTCLLSPLPGYSNMKLGLGGVNFPASIVYPPQSIDPAFSPSLDAGQPVAH